MTAEPYVTRQQAVDVIRAELGIPLGLSALEKAGMRGDGPKPTAAYGRTLLYKRADVLAWAKGLVGPVPAKRPRRERA
jgi:hypothetical protein